MKQNYEYIINAIPKFKNVDEKYALECSAKLQNILSNYSAEALTEGEVLTILDFVVTRTRNLLSNVLKVDISIDPLINRCDLTQAMAGYALEKLGADVRAIDSQKAINNDVDGHSFLIVGFPFKGENLVTKKYYLIDLTYRQFFLKKECEASKYLIHNDMTLVTPQLGYYYLQCKEDMPIASEIVENGYIELNANNAKVYGDSLYITKKGYIDNSNHSFKTNISGDIYMKAFLKANGKYSLTEENLMAIGCNIDIPTENVMRERAHMI